MPQWTVAWGRGIDLAHPVFGPFGAYAASLCATKFALSDSFDELRQWTVAWGRGIDLAHPVLDPFGAYFALLRTSKFAPGEFVEPVG